MNIKPMAQGQGTPAGSEQIGQSASPERKARAAAVMNGQDPNQVIPPQEQSPQQNIKRIQMRTNRTVNRGLPPEVEEESNIPDTSVSTQAPVTEEIKPLSPQFAALAKAKRAIQEERRLLEAEKAKLGTQAGFNPEEYISKAELLARPLGVLQSNGVTYDQLTEAILSDQHQNNPQLTKLELEIQALKQGLENQTKAQVQAQEAQKTQVLKQMARDAAMIVKDGDKYELVRETNHIPEVIQVIDQHFLATGEVLDLEDVLSTAEEEIMKDMMRVTRINKVRSQFVPATAEIPQTQNINGGRSQMRTLTNRDGASAPSSARERAIAAFYGKKL